MPLLHLMTFTNPKMDWCNTLYFNYGHNVTFNFDYTLFSFHNYFLLFRGMVPKLLRQHILLTLVSDPGAPSNSWRGLCHS